MRKSIIALVAIGSLCVPSLLRAEDPAKLIEKCIQATGGVEKLSAQGGQTKTKGNLDVQGATVDFTSELIYQLPNKFKEEVELNVGGQNVKIATTFNGKDYSISANGQSIPLQDKQVAELKDVSNMMQISRLIYLKDKKYELASIGESKINDMPAEGVRVATRGFKDVNLYFDKKTGLLVKIERQALDFQSQQEVNEERLILEHMEVDGLKIPKKLKINRDGKKYMEAEVESYKTLEKVDDSAFDK